MCAPHVHRRFSSAVARGPTPLRAHMRMPTCASLPAQGVFDVTLWCEHEGVAFELLHAVKVLTVEAAVATHIPSAIQNAPSVHGRSLKAGTRLRLPLLRPLLPALPALAGREVPAAPAAAPEAGLEDAARYSSPSHLSRKTEFKKEAVKGLREM